MPSKEITMCGHKKLTASVIMVVIINICVWVNMPRRVEIREITVYKEPKHKYRHVAYNLTKAILITPHDFIKGKSAPEQHSTYQVPNIVHYIWYQNKTVEMRFDKALSILSAIKNLKPDVIYFHTNKEPTGTYFDMLKKYPVFKVVHREPPTDVIKKPPFETTYSNYDRVKILIEQGGIYLDMDVMVVRPFDDVRKYGCTLGMENPTRVCAGIIVCAKEHPLLYLWLDSYYDDFEEYKNIWAFHSGNIPSVLFRRYPHLVHIEPMKFHRPGLHPDFMGSIWGSRTFAWKENYAIHTYIRLRGKNAALPTEESIRTMNSTYGKIARQVFYGSE